MLPLAAIGGAASSLFGSGGGGGEAPSSATAGDFGDFNINSGASARADLTPVYVALGILGLVVVVLLLIFSRK